MLPISYCPDCGYRFECATDTEHEGNQPSPGDLSVCINCTAFLKYDHNMKLVTLPPEEPIPPKVRDLLFKIRQAIHLLKKD